MITPTSKYIKLMGYKRFHYTHWGRNSTFKIILLHGIGESSNIWFQLAPLLANKYEVIALDLRGHGGTPWDTEGDYSLNSYISFFVHLLLIGNHFYGFYECYSLQFLNLCF